MLVVYHSDERHGVLQSKVIFEKGFDNIYLLSGGLCIFEEEFANLIKRPFAVEQASLTAAAGVAAASTATSPASKSGAAQ